MGPPPYGYDGPEDNYPQLPDAVINATRVLGGIGGLMANMIGVQIPGPNQDYGYGGDEYEEEYPEERGRGRHRDGGPDDYEGGPPRSRSRMVRMGRSVSRGAMSAVRGTGRGVRSISRGAFRAGRSISRAGSRVGCRVGRSLSRSASRMGRSIRARSRSLNPFSEQNREKRRFKKWEKQEHEARNAHAYEAGYGKKLWKYERELDKKARKGEERTQKRAQTPNGIRGAIYHY
ncbi:hypothetical protein EJ08DRAFT_676118 [Tothia fuscella]|uniref:Uncharacterized protein n=1 Tax=Tothia fuscella TaxID=1048955 RepID=A0A9P4NZF0_9PEZI|nr:hypothetical protein EJ08DRAFT_676118 [Tothia fuscella]